MITTTFYVWYRAEIGGGLPGIVTVEVPDTVILENSKDTHWCKTYTEAVRWLRGRVDDDVSIARTELSRALSARDKVYKLFQLRKDEV